jgi:hypothetical protein
LAFALAAGIGAGGSVLSGLIGASASSSAAKEQEQASMNNIDFQTNLLGIDQQLLSPYLGAGTNALSTLSGLLTPGANQQATLQSLPGFQFQSKWGTKSAQNALAAEGLGGSTGPLAQGISNYNNGLASTYYGNYVNQLQGLSNTGAQAAQAMTGQNATIGANIGNSLTSQGTAAAAGTLGSANALSGGVTSAAGSASNALILSSLLGSGQNGIFGNIGVSGNSLTSGAYGTPLNADISNIPVGGVNTYNPYA